MTEKETNEKTTNAEKEVLKVAMANTEMVRPDTEFAVSTP